MSRKNLLAGLGGGGLPPASNDASLASGAAPVAHLGKMLGAIRDRSERAEEIEKALAAGDRIVEIDPAVIDPSPIADRLPCSPDADQALRDSIAEHGQRVPVLLRRHPSQPERYLTVYGHRRIAAVRALGRKARAIVVALSDEDAYVAQGVENAERRDLSFIERALFARRLTDAGVAAKAVASALGTARPNVVTMVTLCRRLPDELILAIGSSPALGRRRWEDLDARLVAGGAAAAKRWRRAIASSDFADLDGESRLAAILRALEPETSGRAARASAAFAQEDGLVFGSMEKTRSGEARLRLAPDKDVSFREDGSTFCDWLAGRMTHLRAAWRRGE
jgi:ParB family chromosome partitioning protein